MRCSCGCNAACARQRLQAATQRPCRVVGWYHSHPHITVQPSHVGACPPPLPRARTKGARSRNWPRRFAADVKTQGGYQYLDDCFVGVIFSVFGTSGAGQESVSLCAFQAAQVSFETGLTSLSAALICAAAGMCVAGATGR